jgi:hypothetical protein
MSSNEKLIDENNLLTETGKKVLKLGLQDEKESLLLFNMIRNGYKESIGNMNYVVNQIPDNDHFTYEQLEKTVIEVSELLMNAITKIYTDISFMFDTFEIVNSNHLENRKTIRDLAQALTKSEKVRDDAIRTIVERMEKDKENYQYDNKFYRENFEKLVKTISEFQRIIKYSEREYKDKAKVADGNE